MPYKPYKHMSQYILRYYITNPNPIFRNVTDKLDWESAKKTVNELDEKSKEVIQFVFRSCKPLEESVYNYYCKTGIKTNEIWKIIKTVNKRVAEFRGLI